MMNKVTKITCASCNKAIKFKYDTERNCIIYLEDHECDFMIWEKELGETPKVNFHFNTQGII